MFKGEDISLDVQELTESTENMNAKSLNYYASSFRRLQISRVDDILLGHFTILSAA